MKKVSAVRTAMILAAAVALGCLTAVVHADPRLSSSGSSMYAKQPSMASKVPF